MINKVILVGRITKDPEIKYTSTGIPYVIFTIATDRLTKDSNGERQADFISCVAWRSTAEFMSRYIRKGYMMGVDGRIQTRNYQSTTDNTTRYVTEVVCDSVTNLQPRDLNVQPTTNQNFQQPQARQFNNPPYQQNQGYTNYQANNNNQPNNYQTPEYEKESFDINVADDDLPF